MTSENDLPRKISYPMPSGSLPFKPYTRSASAWSPPQTSGAVFKRGYLSQAIIDVLAIGSFVLFVSTFAVAISAGAFVVSIEVCRGTNWCRR